MMIRVSGNVKRLALVLAVLLGSIIPAAAQTTGDPRTPNARAFHVDASGRVDGVELVYVERPDTAYQLVQARLIDEASAGGNTVAKFAVIDCNGVPISANVYLAWPFPNLTQQALPGNQNQEHMIASGYNPPDVGPLAIFVGDEQGRINSDVIGGLGLPFKRHVSYYLAFKRRCAQVVATLTPTPQPSATPGPSATPTPRPTPGQGTGDLSETNGLLQKILAVLRALAGHLGVAGYAPSY